MRGRKLYYDLGSRRVICNTGEIHSGNYHETTFEEDKITYNLSDNVGCKVLQYGELQSEIENAGSIFVDENDNVIINPKLTMVVDKMSIQINEIATITVNTTADYLVNFQVDNGEINVKNTVNNSVVYTFQSAVSGKYAIVANTDLYGTRMIVIEVI